MSFELAGGPYAVTASRLALAGLEDRLDPNVLFDIRLLVSELVTNCVKHARVGPEESITLTDKDWHLKWADVITGELRVESVPGTHATLVEDANAKVIADLVTKALSPTDPSWLSSTIGIAGSWTNALV